MEKILNKWNYSKKEYEDYKIPGNWNIKVFSDNMEEIINCPHCGHILKVGDSYTSKEIHTGMGMGYMVCSQCYDKEWVRLKTESKSEVQADE